ncbi:hypothetical protein EOM86_13385, partial [Candidatus Nomurabacteria bacterium]|nr:hypothetical protein [Candidatus Nomurabacteria bacterium]
DKPFGEKPRRSFSNDRPEGDRPYGDKPKRTYTKREERPEGGRSYGDRPKRAFSSDRPREDRPYSDRPKRAFSDRPKRNFDGEDSGSFKRDERFARERELRESFDKPQKSFRARAEEYTPKPRRAKAMGDDGIRLNKFIANSGVCSRREADEYIVAGLVSVNGQIVTELGTKIQASDDVRFNGERLKGEEKVYIIMNKPKDFVTTMSDPNAEKTVMDLVTGKCAQRVYPVGRLDKATTGVLLLTNDGDLTEKLTHPSNKVKKIYHVFLDKNLSGTERQKLQDDLKSTLDRTDPHWMEADRRTKEGEREFKNSAKARREFCHTAGTEEHKLWEKEQAQTEQKVGHVKGVDYGTESVHHHPDGKPVRLDYVDYHKDIITDRKPISKNETEEQLAAVKEAG